MGFTPVLLQGYVAHVPVTTGSSQANAMRAASSRLARLCFGMVHVPDSSITQPAKKGHGIAYPTTAVDRRRPFIRSNFLQFLPVENSALPLLASVIPNGSFVSTAGADSGHLGAT